MKDIDVHFFIHGSNSYEFWEIFETTTYIMIVFSLLYGEETKKGLIGGSYSIHERHESCVCNFNQKTRGEKTSSET
jgi:hypothetical protein